MMAKRRLTSGFSLIEVVVYCALASLVVVIVLGWLTVVWQAVGWQGRYSARLIAASLVVDAITRDLRSASREPVDWDMATGVFTKRMVDAHGKAAAICVAWAVEEGIVRRYEGDYNFTLRRWVKQTVSIAGHDCLSIKIRPVCDDEQRFVVRALVIGRWDNGFTYANRPLQVGNQAGIVVSQAVALGNRELP